MNALAEKKYSIESSPPLKKGSDRLLDLIEEGGLYKYIQVFFILSIAAAVYVSGIDFSDNTVTTVFKSSEQKQYHVKKVSEIPKEKEKEEAEKLAVDDDDVLSEEELKQRYYAYVVSRIEANKVYPADEMKKGHEGSIVLQLVIERSGNVQKVRLLRQARYAKLTEAAVAAIRASLPFKAYSKKVKEDQLILQLTIQFNLQ